MSANLNPFLVAQFEPDKGDTIPTPKTAAIDEAARRHGYESRQETTRRRRTPAASGPSDQINIRASVADINAFVEWCERNRYTNREGFHELVRAIASK
jgi:hypothetical protein